MPLSQHGSAGVLAALPLILAAATAQPAKASVTYLFQGMDSSFGCSVVGCPEPSGLVGSFQLTFGGFVDNRSVDCGQLAPGSTDYCSLYFAQGYPPVPAGNVFLDAGVTVMFQSGPGYLYVSMSDPGGNSFGVLFPGEVSSPGSYWGYEGGTLDVSGAPDRKGFRVTPLGTPLGTPAPEPSVVLPLGLGLLWGVARLRISSAKRGTSAPA